MNSKESRSIPLIVPNKIIIRTIPKRFLLQKSSRLRRAALFHPQIHEGIRQLSHSVRRREVLYVRARGHKVKKKVRRQFVTGEQL